MPIRPELRHFYSGPAWEATRKRILDRARNRCEQCGKPNRGAVAVIRLPLFSEGSVPTGFSQFWRGTFDKNVHWIRCSDAMAFPERVFERTFRKEIEDGLRVIRVVLTIAHLNHQAGDDRDENLKALCQWCHLHYDKLHHRDTRAARKDGARPLLRLFVEARRRRAIEGTVPMEEVFGE